MSLDALTKEIDRACVRASVAFSARMFGASKNDMGRETPQRLRLLPSELSRMTPEEVESAIIGFQADYWEALDDEPMPVVGDPQIPNGTICGLSGWLP